MSINIAVRDILADNGVTRDHDDDVVLGLGVALEVFVRMLDVPTTYGMFCLVCEDDRIVVHFGSQDWLPSDSPFSTRAFMPGGLYYIFTPGDQDDWSLFHRFVLPAIAARPGFHGRKVGEYLDAHSSSRC